MIQILSIIVTFVLTGLVGNRLLQAWQHRSWLRQQRFLGAEKEYVALRELSAEISNSASKRIYQMRRLLWAVRSQPLSAVEDRLKIYDEVLTLWNENLNTYYVRLTLFASYYDTSSLEALLHEPFQAAGAELERLVRARRNGAQPSRAEANALERRLNALQGTAVDFSRDLLNAVERKRSEVYFGHRVPYDRRSLEKFSTWELVKALFVSRVDEHSIFRASSDPS